MVGNSQDKENKVMKKRIDNIINNRVKMCMSICSMYMICCACFSDVLPISRVNSCVD